MNTPFDAEIAANLERAEESIKAARQLEADFHDFAASRAIMQSSTQQQLSC